MWKFRRSLNYMKRICVRAFHANLLHLCWMLKKMKLFLKTFFAWWLYERKDKLANMMIHWRLTIFHIWSLQKIYWLMCPNSEIRHTINHLHFDMSYGLKSRRNGFCSSPCQNTLLINRPKLISCLQVRLGLKKCEIWNENLYSNFNENLLHFIV
jgi:hypothetical protein